MSGHGEGDGKGQKKFLDSEVSANLGLLFGMIVVVLIFVLLVVGIVNMPSAISESGSQSAYGSSSSSTATNDPDDNISTDFKIKAWIAAKDAVTTKLYPYDTSFPWVGGYKVHQVLDQPGFYTVTSYVDIARLPGGTQRKTFVYMFKSYGNESPQVLIGD